ncbi:MAG: hypothetical protein M3220_22300, partial [Chloroflexota bacterium]|nr:hypothetical protein [Chloroflexota bacterium]
MERGKGKGETTSNDAPLSTLQSLVSNPHSALRTPHSNFDVAGCFVMMLLFGWIVGVAAGGYVVTWAASELFIIVGMGWPAWLWLFVAVGQSLLLALPLVPLAWRWPRSRFRAIFQTWAWGALFFLFMVPLRLVPVSASVAAAILQVALTSLFIALVWWVGYRGRRGISSGEDPAAPLYRGVLPALLLAPLASYAWLAWHAFGSPLDIVLNGLAALLLGFAASLVVDSSLLRLLHGTSATGWNITLGGFAIGVLLLVMGVAFGLGGMGLLLLLSLPALGWAAMALSDWGRAERTGNWLGMALFVGMVAAAPLTLVDPDELVLVLNLGGPDVLLWALAATGITALVGWILGVVGFLLRERLPSLYPSPLWLGGATVTWLLG